MAEPVTEADTKSWLEWARTKGAIHPEVLAFLEKHPSCIHVEAKYGPSAAMWMTISDICKGVTPEEIPNEKD